MKLYFGVVCVIAAAFVVRPGPVYASAPPLDPTVLRLVGLTPTYVVDAKKTQKSIFTIAAQRAARAHKVNAQLLSQRLPQLTGNELLGPGVAPVATPAPVLSQPPTAWEAAGEAANLAIAFVKVCRPGWVSSSHTCYADLTTGPNPVAWSAPSNTAQQFLGSDDPSSTPPPLASVQTPAPGATAVPGATPPPTAAQVTLTADIAALQTAHPGVAKGTTLPSNLQTALNTAESHSAFLSGLDVPPFDVTSPDVKLALNANDYAMVTFHSTLKPPSFSASSGANVTYGSDFKTDVSFAMNLTVLRQTVAYQKTIANLEASVAVPLEGAPPSLKITSNVLGVSANQLVNYSKSGPALHFSNARKQVATEDLCAYSQPFPIVSSVSITLTVSCPATFGYSLIFDAVPQEASARLAPVVSIGINLDADVKAAAGLVSVGSYASADLITAQGRLGAYADLVQNPNPTGPTADPTDLFIVTRPYEFATVQSGDGYVYIVVKLGTTTTYIKVAKWQPFLARDTADAGTFNAYRLTHK